MGRIYLDKIDMTKNEVFAFNLDASEVVDSGESVSNASDKIIDVSDDSDVSSTNLTGSASISGNTVTTRGVQSLTEDSDYELQVEFDVSTRTYNHIIKIHCLDIAG